MDLIIIFLGLHYQACKFVEENWEPKFTVIIAQKNHHTKFFRDGFPDNVPPGKKNTLTWAWFCFGHCGLKMSWNMFAGTIVDSRICHAHNNDFYLCAHAGIMVSK